MTAAVYRSSTPFLSVPQTQNTAPVLEFNCLYTHDVRRKKKRWQDGFVRYHTFNKRVMLYDVPRNFIGDAHWKSSEALQDGDEVELDKGGVLVQVAESVGTTETDLTELLSSKKKTTREPGLSSVAPPAHVSIQTSGPPAPQSTSQSKHRSLQALLGTPKAPLGKASLPMRSPFDERHADIENQQWPETRSPKRRRVEVPACTVTTTTKPLAQKQPPLWARTTDSAKKNQFPALLQPGRQRLGTKEVIDLCKDGNEPQSDRFLNGFSSDVMVAPSSPQRPTSPAIQQTPRSSSPALQTQALLLNGHLHGRVSPRPSRGRSHPASSHQVPADYHHHVSSRSRETSELGPVCAPTTVPQRTSIATSDPVKSMLPPNTKPRQPLRMSASATRKKSLLCQPMLSHTISQTRRVSAGSASGASRDATSPGAVPTESRDEDQRLRLRQRLAKINEKERTVKYRDRKTKASIRDGTAESSNADPLSLTDSDVNVPTAAPGPTTLAGLDQMLLPPTSPRKLDLPNAVLPPLKQSRQLRRVVSDATTPSANRTNRPFGAAFRLTPSPEKLCPIAADANHILETAFAPLNSKSELPSDRTWNTKTLQPASSLNVASNGTSTVILRKPFQDPKAPSEDLAPPPKDPEPWSREAFDLFTWRPPAWDEKEWCVKAVSKAILVGE